MLAFGMGLAWLGTPAAAASPELTVELAPPWEIVHSDDQGLAVRHGVSGHGVRVMWTADEVGRVPGITPVHAGRAVEITAQGRRWPLFASAFPDRPLRRVHVESQGVDLVVRLEGPPLSSLTEHPGATDDPVLTWVRLRPRGEDWRLVVDGLTTLSLAAEGLTVHPVDEGEITVANPADGAFTFSPVAPAWHSALDASRWQWSNLDALDVALPYPRLGITWTPPVSP